MKTMWAPWRIEYVTGQKEKGCVFCKALDEQDDLTLYKGRTVMVLMNKFPYSNGHLLVAPIRHISGLDALENQEMAPLLTLIEQSVAIIRERMSPDGFNVGLNLGKVAGAGVEEHLHFHIVPRWYGDVNALTVFGDVRVIPEHIRSTYANLKPGFDQLETI